MVAIVEKLKQIYVSKYGYSAYTSAIIALQHIMQRKPSHPSQDYSKFITTPVRNLEPGVKIAFHCFNVHHAMKNGMFYILANTYDQGLNRDYITLIVSKTPIENYKQERGCRGQYQHVFVAMSKQEVLDCSNHPLLSYYGASEIIEASLKNLQ